MRHYIAASALVVASIAFPATAQTTGDRAAVARLPTLFSAAWATHRGEELGELVSDDVDFVNVGAIWLHGKADFAKYHSRILSGRLATSTITPLAEDVRFLGVNLAFVRWSWRIDGEKDSNGDPTPVRYGLMTLIVRRQNRKWQVIAGQNTNSGPQRPEASDIIAPIVVPRAP